MIEERPLETCLRWVFDDTPQEQHVMEFRLVYSGKLLGASRNKTRADVKHAIRREFHPQLRRLWQTKERLREIVKRTGFDNRCTLEEKVGTYDRRFEYPILDHPSFEGKDGDDFYRDLGTDVIADKWARCGFRFWPLVTEEYCTACSIDVLFLRPEQPGMLMQSGDIDGRLKTLFDALRIPKNRDETDGMGPQADEDPFYCLLEDDKLITEVKVTTDQLLLLPKEREITPNDALLVIKVKIWATSEARFHWAWR